MKTLPSLLLWLGLSSVAFAQSEPAATPQPLPPGPLLNPVPDNIQWTVTSNGVTAGQAAAPTPGDQRGKPSSTPPAAKVVVGQNNGDIRHVVTTYGNGSKMEIWKKARAKRKGTSPANNSKTEVWEKGGSQYVMSTGWAAPVISDAGSDETYGDLSWISEKNFDRIVKVNGVECMVFRDSILPPGVQIGKTSGPLKDLPPGFTPPPVIQVDPETLKVKAVACIEVERRLPTVLQIGDEVTTFKFEPLDPQTAPTPPPAVEASLTSRAQQIQAATRKSVQP